MTMTRKCNGHVASHLVNLILVIYSNIFKAAIVRESVVLAVIILAFAIVAGKSTVTMHIG